MSKRAIIVVDIQNEYFPSGKWPLVGIEDAADNVVNVIAAARRSGVPVIHVRHEFPNADAPLFVAGSPGAEIHASVRPHEKEPVVVKQYANAFRDTALKHELDERGIQDVVIVGAMSHNCIDATVRAAFDYGYVPIVLHDACATCDLEFNGATIPATQVHDAIMAALALHAQVMTASAYLSR